MINDVLFARHLEQVLRIQRHSELLEHPVLAQLVDFYAVRLKAFCAMSFMLQIGPTGAALRSELEELHGWAFKGSRRWTDDDDYQVGDFVVRHGGSYEVGRKLAKAVRQSWSQKRPAKKRAMAIRAKELKDAHPTLSWMEVTEKVCDCQHHHTESCKDQLKSAVSDLNNLLKKYQENKP
jgi:hypothetical protein